MFGKLKQVVSQMGSRNNEEPDLTPSQQSLRSLEKDEQDIVEEIQRLRKDNGQEAPDARQAVLDKLLALINLVKSHLGDSESDEDSQQALKECKARLEARTGMELIKEGRTAQDGLDLAQEAMKVLQDNFKRDKNMRTILDVYNHMAVFWNLCSQDDRAMKFLLHAETIYKQWESLSENDEDDVTSSGPESKENPFLSGKEFDDSVKAKYAQTLYLLADLSTRLGRKQYAAKYCSDYLALTAKIGRRETLEWVGGCNQMAEYYTHTNELPLAQYLLLCAHSTLQSVKEKYDKSKVEHKNENEEDLRSVDAAIALSWAKLYSKRLQIAAHPGSETSPLIHKVPEDMRCFSPSDENFHQEIQKIDWTGKSAKLENQAKDLYNQGIRQLKQALEFYTMEQSPVMHVNTVLEISEITRWLADFIPDKHQKCILHKQRTKRLRPVLEEIDKTKLLDAYKTVHLDIGNAFKEIAEIKFEENREQSKVSAPAREAIPHYEAFLDTYKVKKSLPDRIEDEGQAELFVTAVFYLARMYSRLDPPVHTGNWQQTEGLRKAVALYQYCVKFIKDNDLREQQGMAETCKQLAALIVENAEMMRVTAQKAQKQKGLEA